VLFSLFWLHLCLSYRNLKYGKYFSTPWLLFTFEFQVASNYQQHEFFYHASAELAEKVRVHICFPWNSYHSINTIWISPAHYDIFWIILLFETLSMHLPVKSHICQGCQVQKNLKGQIWQIWPLKRPNGNPDICLFHGSNESKKANVENGGQKWPLTF